jgi:hypothetical protein
VGYLGITDQLTLTTRINYFPEQKIIWGENSTLDRSINLNVDPELTLSYRPIEYLEIFGNFDYHQYKTTQNATQVKVLVIVDYDPSTGDPIYEERTLSSFGHPPFTTTSTIFRIGVTYSGKLW